MKLINDLSDLPRFASLLNNEYKEKLTNDVNLLLIKYMDEQSKNVNNTPVDKNNIEIEIAKNDIKESNLNSVSTPVAKPFENIYKAKLLQNTNKPNFPPPPPPLPQNNLNNINPPKLKPNSFLQRPIANLTSQKPVPTKIISIFDSLGYVLPELTEEGEINIKSFHVNSEPYKFLRQVDGSTTLKQIYMINYPSSVSPLQFIEKTMEINQDINMTFRASGSFALPSDTDILFRLGDLLVGFGFIDEKTLESALSLQRKDTKVFQGDEELLGYDAAEARKENNKNIKRISPLLGDILVDMKAVSQQQVELLLKIQKWYRSIIDKVR